MSDEDQPLWTLRVGWTNSRPVRPDEHVTTLRLRATDENDALRAADSWIASRPGVWWMAPSEMMTSCTVLEVEL